eukprot:5842896-Lingulodinium_polyedra.AAC.1
MDGGQRGAGGAPGGHPPRGGGQMDGALAQAGQGRQGGEAAAQGRWARHRPRPPRKKKRSPPAAGLSGPGVIGACAW